MNGLSRLHSVQERGLVTPAITPVTDAPVANLRKAFKQPFRRCFPRSLTTPPPPSYPPPTPASGTYPPYEVDIHCGDVDYQIHDLVSVSLTEFTRVNLSLTVSNS